MIKISGIEADLKALFEKYPRESAEGEILEKLSKSDRVYDYTSMDELTFETELRRSIMRASMELYRGRLGFRTFKESKCNEAFWDRNEDGGFVLKKGVKPSAAIRDIFKNTRKYATECATAIVIVFYGAVLEAYSDELFNTAFTELTLMNWTQLDELMGIATYRRLDDYLPGDCRYFRNPDVNPLTPEWQGENAIDLSGGSYYGHGIGIGSKEKIIKVLNDNRIEDAQASAYLMDTATRPNFESLYQYKKNATSLATSVPGSAAATAAPTTTTAIPTAVPHTTPVTAPITTTPPATQVPVSTPPASLPASLVTPAAPVPAQPASTVPTTTVSPSAASMSTSTTVTPISGTAARPTRRHPPYRVFW